MKIKNINKTRIARLILCFMLTLVTFQTCYYLSPATLQCDTDIIKVGSDVAEDVGKDVKKLAIACLPVILIVVGLFLMFANNDKKIAQLFSKIALAIGGFILIILAANGTIANTLSQIFGD